MDSCEALSKYHRQLGSSAETQIVKRDNEVETDYVVTEVPREGLYIAIEILIEIKPLNVNRNEYLVATPPG